MSVLEERAERVIGLFRNLFECAGQTFGSPSHGVSGVSDGYEGVQWNAGYSQHHEAAWLGVNLEGKKYDDWPVSRLIEREIADPLLLSEYRIRVARPGIVTIRWTRDAWQAGVRVKIKESRLPPTPVALDQLDDGGWTRVLRCAKGCLDPERNHRGRRRTTVTLFRAGELVERDVSPHLSFKTEFDWFGGNTLLQAKNNLAPLHEFAIRQARPL